MINITGDSFLHARVRNLPTRLEEEVGEGWASIRIIFLRGLIGLIAFLLYTQREFIQSGLAYISAIIGIVAPLLNFPEERQKKNKSSEPL